MDAAPILRRERHVARIAEPKLFQRDWMPADPARVLLIVHGFGEHSGCYEQLASWFARRRCAVFAFDQRGYGRAGGARAHARRFGDYLDDLAEVMGAAGGRCPGRPLYLVGHDLGALVSALFLQERQADVAGALLSGMPLSQPAACSTLRALSSRLLAALAPRWRLRAGREGENLGSNPAVAPAFFGDPLVERTPITASLHAQHLRAVERLRASAVAQPLLLLYGEQDSLCDPRDSQHFARAAPHGQLRSYPGLPHAIFHGPTRETVFADMLAWLHEREEGPA